jgi:LytS/YehU family sensor histidine kinase
MPSSTSHHGSLNTRLLGVLLIGVLGTPLIWLTTLEIGYVLAYQTCDDHAKSWVLTPTIASIVLVAVIAAISAVAHRRAARERTPMPLVGWLAVGMSALMVLVLIASAVAPAILQPCD